MRVTQQQPPPAFEVEAHEIDGVAVVVVRGEVDLVTAPQLEAAVDQAILDHGAPRPLLVDLAECTFMDSSGLAIILRAQDRLRAGARRGPLPSTLGRSRSLAPGALRTSLRPRAGLAKFRAWRSPALRTARPTA